MKKILSTFLFATLYVASFAQTSHASEWGYSGETGPTHWGDLSPEYATCAKGKNQSPVDIRDPYNYDHAPIKFDYDHLGNNVYFGGHGLVINFESAGFTLENHKYQLDQLHFHSPSEHRIAGKSFPLEAHFVNSDKNGNLAVVSVLFRQGAENKNIQKLLNKTSENK
ncbi:MAG: carbonic anhydrase family protein, partial [Sneathiella sp.]